MSHRITISPKYEYLRSFLSSVPDVFSQEGKEIYHLRNVIKVMQTPDGKSVNVKRYHVPRGINRFVYSSGLRKPKAERAYSYAPILLEKGILTPEPMALIEDRDALGLLGYSYFISTQIEWGHTYYDFGNAQKGEYEDAAIALARYAANMHGKEVLHKDFTPGNVLWHRDADGYHLAIVDINRMYFGPVDIKHGLLNLKKFWGPKRFTEILVSEYARCRHFDEKEALSIVMPAREKFWLHYQKRHEIPFKLEL